MAIASRCCSCLLLLISAPVLFLILGVAVENFLFFEDSSRKVNSNMSAAELIAKNKVKNAVTGEHVTMESFWENQPVVIIFFRRWGCAFCRLAARELTAVKPELDANNVRLIGIGVEDLGKEDFINGNHFGGELYIDEEKKCYKDLEYKRYGKFTIWPALMTKTSLNAIWASRAQNVGGDTKGDIYQVGGTLVISAGGDKVLLNHKQESLADHVNVNEVLSSLGIAPKEAKATENVNGAQCNAAKGEEATPCE